MTRNLVLCLDGTSNEPEADTTNVARIFEAATKDESQLVYYDPGVGTMGARGAVTALGKRATRISGLVGGFGVTDNIEEAYTWLMHHWQPGDQIYLFGFSRGAYTARAVAGMLCTVGLLRPGAENLVPYALKLYTKSGKDDPTPDQEKDFWRVRRGFTAKFGNPSFPHAFDATQKQVHFLGAWDTVKSVGWLNWKARIEQARWPFTAKLSNVDVARHALAIDERRRPFPAYRFDPKTVAASEGRFLEMWFAGVHSDVGGQYPDDHQLSDLAFLWMVDEAAAAGLKVERNPVHRLVGVRWNQPLPGALHLGVLHRNAWMWVLAGGWRSRRVLPGDHVHPSVLLRIDAMSDTPTPYRPTLPE
jgi:uncharacterized protein (DUF2235 family)